jgi:RNA polymerase sporulation-specific sigma factor
LLDVLGTEPEIVADMVESTLEQERLLDKVKRLNRREMNVLELRFGLFNGNRKTQKEIARKLGISRNYVSRIEKRAINKLIKEFKAEGC